MDWRLIMIQALMYLIEKNGPRILDAIGDFLIALIRSLTPPQQAELVKNLSPATDKAKKA